MGNKTKATIAMMIVMLAIGLAHGACPNPNINLLLLTTVAYTTGGAPVTAALTVPAPVVIATITAASEPPSLPPAPSRQQMKTYPTRGNIK
ncbi:hypothetical protein RND81_14G199400 [Saponaria officinalis]|uniref:Uncharacterized protein n=1 Tax=Saponaria officinalis TaxID=3572 RepID=A0AAW1GRX2_SAPOF